MFYGYDKRLKMLSKLSKTNLTTLAKSIDCNPTCFSTKMKNGKFTIAQKKTMAKAAEAEYIARFLCPDGKIFEGDSIRDMLVPAAENANMTINRVAMIFRINNDNLNVKYSKLNDNELENVFVALGIINCGYNFNTRLKNDKFTDIEVSELAKIVGCEYQNYFQLQNHMQI